MAGSALLGWRAPHSLRGGGSSGGEGTPERGGAGGWEVLPATWAGGGPGPRGGETGCSEPQRSPTGHRWALPPPRVLPAPCEG